MDKYEFSIKAEQIKKMVGQGDYKTAMQIADTIDWNRVRNANLLSSIAEIYEKNGEYEEAKDILLLAFERAPVGKRFLYKLSELSLSSGSIEDAVEFYKEFLDVSPEDPRKFLLQYMILKAKGAMASQLVRPLEQFTATELEEQWLYELAKLYGEAGREEDCVRTCDKMILLFGMGKYVDKAMDLKLHYRPFREEETAVPSGEEAVENAVASVVKEKPEMKKEVQDSAPQKEESPEEFFDAVENEPQEESSEGKEEAEEEETNEEEPVQREVLSTEKPETASAAEEVKFTNYHMIIEAKTLDEAFKIAVEEIKYFHKEYHLDFKVAKIDADKLNEKGFAVFADKLKERDLIIVGAGRLKYSVLDEIEQHILHPEDDSSVILVDEVDHFDRLAEDRPKFLTYFDIVSNHEEEEENLLEDVDLDGETEEQSSDAMKKDISSEDEESYPVEADEEDEYLDEEEQEYVPHKPSIFERPARPYTEVLEEEAKKEGSEDEETLDGDEEFTEPEVEERRQEGPSSASMDIEEFAQYAIDYAKSIDCSITDKGITALYERIQLMEEDGIILNKESARDLIEETADQAEKPSIGKKIGSLFRPKYDKDDKLILREEHFMG